MNTRVKEIFQNSALLIFSVCFALLVSEFFVRTLAGSKTDSAQKLFFEEDALLGWRHVPNTKGYYTSKEYKTYESINSKGVRGPEYSYLKQPGEYRILILGDSFAEGYTVEFDQLFSEVLKQRLNYKGLKYEVINMGTAGYSTDQEYLLYLTEGKKYSADLVILLFYENDVLCGITHNPSVGVEKEPFFQLLNGKLELVEASGTTRAGSKPDGDRLKVFLRQVTSWVKDKFMLDDFIEDKLENIIFVQNLLHKYGLIQVPGQFRVWKKVLDDDMQNAWRITEALIVRLRDEVVLQGSQFLVVYVPGKESIYNEIWEETKKKYNLSDDAWSRDQALQVLSSLCRKNNMDLLDPTEALQQKADEIKKTDKRLYFSKDIHWTKEGHEMIGEILAAYVEK